MSDAARAYGRPDKALGGYAVAMGVFSVAAGAVALTARLTGRRPAPLSPYELACLSLATHKISRIAAKDAVTSPLRAPFTRFQGSAGDAEIAEEVTDTGRWKAVGELISCPFCLGPWVAASLMAGHTFAPTFTRATVTVFSAVAASDFMQLGYAAAQQRTTPSDERDS